jgi:PST family polysaccharide transporter
MLRKLSSTILLQAINTALPFITMPYYVQKLGVDGYGQIGVAIAIIQYLLMCVDFGFTLPSIRSIARSENKKSDASKIFANTIVIKFIILMSGIFFINVVFIIFSINIELKLLINIGYLLVLGQLLTPSWIFVGRQSGDLLLVFTIMPRVLVIPAMIFFVKQEDDLNIAMLLQVMPSILTAFLSVYWAISIEWMVLVRPNFAQIKHQIHAAWPLFISSAATSLYTSSTPIILNLLTGAYSVGVFLIADKIRQGLLAILPPISLVIYPKMAQEFSTNIKAAYSLIKKMTIFMLVGMMTISISVLFSSEKIITLIFGNHAIQSVGVLRIMSISIVFTCLNTILGSYIMLPLGAEKSYSKILLLAGFFHIAATSVLVAFFGYNGAAIGILVTEFFMAALMILLLMNKNSYLDKCHYRDSVFRKILMA